MPIAAIIRSVDFTLVLLPHGNRFQTRLTTNSSMLHSIFPDSFPSSVSIFNVLSLLFCSQPKIEEIIPVCVVYCRLKSRMKAEKLLQPCLYANDGDPNMEVANRVQQDFGGKNNSADKQRSVDKSLIFITKKTLLKHIVKSFI